MKPNILSRCWQATALLMPCVPRGAIATLLAVTALASLSACVQPGVYQTGPELEGGDPAVGEVAGSEGYLIGPEDLLGISVWQEPDLTREVRVRPDGGISFPLAGNVDVAGKSTEEVTAIITERVQKYIPAAVVTVSVEEVAGYNIFVIGQVNSPGKFVLGRYVDVIQALTLAGGLTPFANANNITVRRRIGDRELVLPFDYGAVADGDAEGQNVVLHSGDVVVVP